MKPISDKFIKYDIIRISNESGARSKTIFYAIFDYDSELLKDFDWNENLLLQVQFLPKILWQPYSQSQVSFGSPIDYSL